MTLHTDAGVINNDLEGPIFRVLLWGRLLFVGIGWYVTFHRRYGVEHPALAALINMVVLAWTFYSSWLYIHPQSRKRWVFRVDMALTLIVVLASPSVLGLEAGRLPPDTLAGTWAAGAPLAIAIHGGWLAGAGSASVLVAFRMLVMSMSETRVLGDQLLMIGSAAGLGYMVDQMRRSLRARDAYYSTAAALAERARLSRIVHDGVLQVLALVAREAPAWGQRGQELAKAALQQEVGLRALLQDREIDVESGVAMSNESIDFAAVLDMHGGENVTVSIAADDIRVSRARGDEMNAIVTEALANVRKHAGDGAHAWVLLEQEESDIVISVRDNGLGAPEELILGGAERGRMGVRDSIQGRVTDLGGVSTLRARPGRGVEWEFRIPME